MSKSTSLFARHAYIDNAWANNVRISWAATGDISAVDINVEPTASDNVQTYVLPGMINLHSHAFQRAMAGMTEMAGNSEDSFWTWRDLMYRFALALNPDQIEAIAAQLYVECLRHGYTSVCEFHYLHRAPSGDFYSNKAETALRIAAAAHQSGMGVTILPVLYSYADFGAAPLRAEQRRFSTNAEQIAELVQLLESARNGQIEVGAAPHSLRAASILQITQLSQYLPANRPIHIHIAEQMPEVKRCLEVTGQRPVELLLNTQKVDNRWCLVHATHLSAEEVNRTAKSGAIVGICPSTEGNLGDGFFPLVDFINQQGTFGIGSDSHVSQSPIEELRWLEYGQRLQAQRRNRATNAQQKRVGDFLWQQSLVGGAQASGRHVGAIAVGKRADLLVLDDKHPNLDGINTVQLLNTWIFSGNDNLVRDVLVGGQWQVQGGKHREQENIAQRFKQTMQALRSL